MIKKVYAVYDTVAGLYDSPMVFDNEKLAIASIRRNIRNMYLKGEVVYDELRERQLVELGTYNTIAGTFANNDPESEDFSFLKINFSSFVGDLKGDFEDEI